MNRYSKWIWYSMVGLEPKKMRTALADSIDEELHVEGERIPSEMKKKMQRDTAK